MCASLPISVSPWLVFLQEAHIRQVMPEYVRTLLEAFTSNVAPAEGSAAALPEPLSEREQEILSLIAAGLTNREIRGQAVHFRRDRQETHRQHLCEVGRRQPHASRRPRTGAPHPRRLPLTAAFPLRLTNTPGEYPIWGMAPCSREITVKAIDAGCREAGGRSWTTTMAGSCGGLSRRS